MDNNLQRTSTVSDKLKALSHPCRMLIVQNLLEHSCNVTTIQQTLGVPQPSISAHLARLKTAGIIQGQRHGQEIHYEVVDDDTKKLVESLF